MKLTGPFQDLCYPNFAQEQLAADHPLSGSGLYEVYPVCIPFHPIEGGQAGHPKHPSVKWRCNQLFANCNANATVQKFSIFAPVTGCYVILYLSGCNAGRFG